jgi:ribosome-binding factor A
MTGAAQHKRSDRVGERIRAELMEMITRGAFRDPGLSSCYVTEVKLTEDLRHCRVYVRSLLTTEVSAADRERVIAGLGRAAGYIRRELAPRLKLKYHPELKFFWDDNVDRARRVEELLHEIEKETP